MLNSDLRQLLKADPFEPFQLELVSGERFVVEHRDFLILFGASRSAATHFTRDGLSTVINTGLIVKIEYLKNKVK